MQGHPAHTCSSYLFYKQNNGHLGVLASARLALLPRVHAAAACGLSGEIAAKPCCACRLVPAASVSFGNPREFLLRRNTDPADKYRFWLGAGSLLVMRSTTQQHWMHSVPKRKGLEGERVNLTFRLIIHKESQRRRQHGA
jgi:hypothetical protein